MFGRLLRSFFVSWRSMVLLRKRKNGDLFFVFFIIFNIVLRIYVLCF